MGFETFGFSQELLDGLDAMNFREPTPIQQQAIPEILAGKDLIASAQTGTGKTAAFLLPIIESNLKNNTGKIDTLIIVPTRELGLQIDQQQSIHQETVVISKTTDQLVHNDHKCYP